MMVAVFACLLVNAQTSTTTKKSSTTTSNKKATPGKTTTTQRKTTTTKAGSSPATSRTTEMPATSENTIIKSSATKEKSPFVSGIHAAPNAEKKLDTNNRAGTNVNTNRTTTSSTSSTVGVVVPGGNDTTFNVNTIGSTNSVNTNSGAVDRSGQSQFGQTNWGRNERNTIGESQWTVPPPITSSFNKEFPSANSATWIRNNVDTTQYSVRYKTGATWVTSTYNGSGNRLDMRTEIPLVQAPTPVSIYLSKQPSNFKINSISRLQVQGKPDVYELRLSNGKTAYVNNDGMEVKQ
jgi:hypothetical protein